MEGFFSETPVYDGFSRAVDELRDDDTAWTGLVRLGAEVLPYDALAADDEEQIADPIGNLSLQILSQNIRVRFLNILRASAAQPPEAGS